MDADIGVAFDGDADRLGVVTSVGEIIYSDRLMMLFAKMSSAGCRARPLFMTLNVPVTCIMPSKKPVARP